MKEQLSKIALIVLACGFYLGSTDTAHGNAISVTNLSIAGASGGIAEIQFDVSWSNSWHLSWSEDGGGTTITNWDAAWLFLKFKTPGGTWRHGLLAANGHTSPSGAQIDVGSNGSDVNVGVFVRRSSSGSGSFSAQGVRIRWDYASSGLGGTNDVDLSLHAIEMVYIPSGMFALGSGGGESGSFYASPNSSSPFWITSENAIIMGSTAGALRTSSTSSGTISAEFPKGFRAVYSMKYEISQGQYASFLNHLDPGQADLRFPNLYGTDRFTIRFVGGNYVADAPDRACNYLNFTDILSYLSWAGLRPMTELEYEKICRGSMPPEPNEFAWGSSSITLLTGFDGVDGSGSEKALPQTANANYYIWGVGPSGPVRVGIFAESGSSRQTSGASYYGVMEMSGNVSELAVSATSAEGRNFIPLHGSGSHTPLPADWQTFQGYIRRGGSWDLDDVNIRTSHRSTSISSTRQKGFGGRGVRTAP